jgi:hypothetical protein
MMLDEKCALPLLVHCARQQHPMQKKMTLSELMFQKCEENVTEVHSRWRNEFGIWYWYYTF